MEESLLVFIMYCNINLQDVDSSFGFYLNLTDCCIQIRARVTGESSKRNLFILQQGTLVVLLFNLVSFLILFILIKCTVHT